VIDNNEVPNLNIHTTANAVAGWNSFYTGTTREIKDGTRYDKNLHTDPDGFNPFATGVRMDGSLLAPYFSTYEELENALMVGNISGNGTPAVFNIVPSGRSTAIVISFIAPLPYTKLTFVDHPAMTSSLENFGGGGLPYVAIIDSPTKPNATGEGTKIFGAGGRVDLSCKECGSLFPVLKLVNSSQNVTHSYMANIFKQDLSCTKPHRASSDSNENWFQANNVYATSNASAPLKQHQFSEIYFDDEDGNKIKLDNMGC
jgi:hypothetical protein